MKKLDTIREILKNTNHKKPTQIFCPRCANPKIQLTSTLANWLTPTQYYCEQCGYIGTIVMELEKENPEKT